jgi:hypothetical protein
VSGIDAGAVLNRASVGILTAFNAPGTFQLGTPTDPTLVMDGAEVNLEEAATYDASAIVEFPTATTLQLSVLTGATSGNGILVVKFSS